MNVVCIDSSEHSERAFQWYCDKLHREEDQVGLIHIHQLPSVAPVGLLFGGGPSVADFYQKSIEASVSESKELVKKYEKHCQERGMNVVAFCETADDSVGHTICKIAKEHSASVIVIGQRGSGAIRCTFLGSISDYVIHHAHIPTIVVPPEETK